MGESLTSPSQSHDPTLFVNDILGLMGSPLQNIDLVNTASDKHT